MFKTKTTVDTIVNDFTKTVNKLASHAAGLIDEADKHELDSIRLTTMMENKRKEATRALAISDKINALVAV